MACFFGFLIHQTSLTCVVVLRLFFVFGYVSHNFRLILASFDRSLNWFLAIAVILLPLAIMATASEFATADVAPQTHAVAVARNACLT